jgi:putative hydrolase of the HAD superfamily
MDSPLHAIARYERDHGLAHNAINHAIVARGDQGAWSRLERGELGMDAFFGLFEEDCRAEGLSVDGRRMLEYIAEASNPRPQMLQAIRRIREEGLGVGALTNNWVREDAPDAPPTANPLRELFDVFVESSVVGLRKPDPRIYQLVCRELSIEPAQAVFLDDIGRNLKSARALGMTTIKVDEPDAALQELEEVLGFSLRA